MAGDVREKKAQMTAEVDCAGFTKAPATTGRFPD